MEKKERENFIHLDERDVIEYLEFIHFTFTAALLLEMKSHKTDKLLKIMFKHSRAKTTSSLDQIRPSHSTATFW